MPTNGNFTFGFINAIVNSSGVPVETSPGVDQISPSDTGEGAGGTGTTNDWIATVNAEPGCGLRDNLRCRAQRRLPNCIALSYLLRASNRSCPRAIVPPRRGADTDVGAPSLGGSRRPAPPSFWCDSAKTELAAALKLTAEELFTLGLIDTVVGEPAGGAYEDADATVAFTSDSLLRALGGFSALGPDQLVE